MTSRAFWLLAAALLIWPGVRAIMIIWPLDGILAISTGTAYLAAFFFMIDQWLEQRT